MMESENLEFKREVTDSLIKEIIAFLNTNGGTIMIGYNDDGSIYGLENARNDLDRISNKIYDNIEPNVSFLVSSRIERIEEKDVIILEVLKGVNKPYYIKSKGMIPNGVFIRLGAVVKMATSELIREMIIESSNITFEKNISTNQDLTFLYATKAFKEKGLNFTVREQKNLGIINENDKYTNLGLLLSDQSPYTVKMAIYEDNNKQEFIDTKEASGSVLEVLDEVLTYLKLNNKKSSKIKGIRRIDCYDYPLNSLREVLLNAVGHRDYTIPGSILIHIYKDKMEFLSLGGLAGGLTIEDIKLGSSSSRNPKLINIFHHLGLVEAYGSGIPRIFSSYKNSIDKPNIKIAPNTFLFEIPKISTKKEYNKIINYIDITGGATRSEIQEVLSLKKGATINLLNEMQQNNIIEKVGHARDIIYRLK